MLSCVEFRVAFSMSGHKPVSITTSLCDHSTCWGYPPLGWIMSLVNLLRNYLNWLSISSYSHSCVMFVFVQIRISCNYSFSQAHLCWSLSVTFWRWADALMHSVQSFILSFILSFNFVAVDQRQWSALHCSTPAHVEAWCRGCLSSRVTKLLSSRICCTFAAGID